jgi:hypothetical protein
MLGRLRTASKGKEVTLEEVVDICVDSVGACGWCGVCCLRRRQQQQQQQFSADRYREPGRESRRESSHADDRSQGHGK